MFQYPEKEKAPLYEKDVASSREDARLQEDQLGWMPASREKVQQMREKDQSMKSTLRFVRVVVRIATLALSIFTLYTQAYILNKYLTTRGIIRDGRNAWATNTQIWPTIVLLVTSCLTIIVTSITLISYAWGVKTANWANNRITNPVNVVELLAHLAIWIATAVSYRIGKTGSDLWGWTCSSKAQGIQVTFGEVNFDLFCSVQSNAWAASLAQVALFIVTCVAWFIAWRREKHKNKLKQRESLLMPMEYQNNPTFGRDDSRHP